MRKWIILVAIVLFALLFTPSASTAELAGVSMPDAVQVGSTRLVLNGLGLRKKFVVKVYVAGLYVAQKSSDPRAIMQTDAPKRIVMHFLHDASKKQMVDAFTDSFNDNAPAAAKAAKSEIDRFLAALEPVKEGDQMLFTFVPGKGTTFALNGTEKLTISSSAFAEALLSVWLGPKPPNADLKKGMLGQ